MRLSVVLAFSVFGLIVLFGIYKLFARAPDPHDDPDSRLGYGSDGAAGGGD